MKNTNDDGCDMEERLKYICGLVNDWLKFAEAKNAAMVAAVCALIVVGCDHFPASTESWPVRWTCFGGCALLILAGGLSLASFIPKLTFKWTESKTGANAEHNLFYFEHIAAYSAFGFLDALYDAESQESPKRKLEVDLAGQAVINSQIASSKFLQFKTACWVALAGFVLLGVSACLQIFK